MGAIITELHQQVRAAEIFSKKWAGRGNEEQDDRSFWIQLLQEVFGVANATDYLDFQKHTVVNSGKTKKIDIYIPSTKVIIEQKSLNIDLDKPQSGHNGKTPYEQAKEYDDGLTHDEKAHWIVLSNFREIWIYNMGVSFKQRRPIKISLEELPVKLQELSFLVDPSIGEVVSEVKLSKDAGDLIAKIYHALEKQYKNPESKETQRSLNALCVRLVFCFFAEDAGLFGHDQFKNYMAQFNAKNWYSQLELLFKMLNTDYPDRDGKDSELEQFPYVNGGLFDGLDTDIPAITDEIKDLILKEGCGFNWRDINPTIFGACFESTMNPENRRSGGMHYTTIEYIHKVIDPLFLNDLEKELDEIKKAPIAGGSRTKKLLAFQNKISSLTFLDPACGSGNFLTETYISLRRLENEVIEALCSYYQKQIKGQFELGITGEEIGVKVSISQFYGIEINDFAVSVAKTAMWIAEAQMMIETRGIDEIHKEYLPLKTNAFIKEANALTFDWEELISKDKLNYIMGNPPFVAKTGRTSSADSHSKAILSSEQKAEKEQFFGKNAGVLDYVSCWFKKAADYTRGTDISTAFVATSSICQGQQVEPLWSVLLKDDICINYAYPSFKWVTEISNGAYVYVVIVGFSHKSSESKIIYTESEKQIVSRINPYLFDGEDILIPTRKTPLCNVPEIGMGNQPIDGGNYLFKEEEMNSFLSKEPNAKAYFHKWYGAEEFINNKPRYCLWLGECSPLTLQAMPLCLERVSNVRKLRMMSHRKSTVKLADKPTRFQTENMPKGNFIVIPEVSSGARKYIPMGYMDDTVLCGNTVRLMPGATKYHFGVLMSSVHMAWMRKIGGFFGPSNRYSIDIVYNNFPWPDLSKDDKNRIEMTAQAILDARALYSDASLADMYGEHMYLYPELVAAHKANDKAVLGAYRLQCEPEDEVKIVRKLMTLYQEMAERI